MAGTSHRLNHDEVRLETETGVSRNSPCVYIVVTNISKPYRRREVPSLQSCQYMRNSNQMERRHGQDCRSAMARTGNSGRG